MRFDKLKRMVDPTRPITYGIVQAGPEFEGGVPYIRPADMLDEGGVKDIRSVKHTSPHIAQQYRRSAVKTGDLVISIGPSFGKVMEVPQKLDGANLTQGTARVSTGSKLNARFAFWCLRSHHCFSQWEAGIGGATFRALNLGPLAETRIPNPDLETQRQIVDFLDRETARIDLLIEKKQRLVALLGEKAKSVNELFFINGDATGTQPLHRLYRIVTGKTPSRNEEDNFSDEEGLPWATPANLGFLAPVAATKEFLTEKGCAGQPVVDAGTVLLNGIGASVGKIGIAGTKLSFNQQIHALRPKKRVLADRFLFFQLLTLKEQLVLLANSTTLPILNAERLGRLELKIFDLEEQRCHCENMDALLRHEEITAQRINTSIDRLKEYRSALITAAVTGQIDVASRSRSGATERRLDALQEEVGA